MRAHKSSRIYLIRHGHSTANAKSILAGRDPKVSLTAKGREQAQSLAKSLAGVSFEKIADKVNEAIDFYFGDTDVQFIAEPGRFMVQKSHTLVVCVVAKKKTDEGFIYYINDGVYGSFNCIIFDHQDPVLIPVKYIENGSMYPSKIFGNTCDSLDEIKKCVMLTELHIGDFLYVKNFGAYTTSAKSDGFNGYKVDNFQYIEKHI